MKHQDKQPWHCGTRLICLEDLHLTLLSPSPAGMALTGPALPLWRDTLSGSRWGSAGFASSIALPLAVESYLDINTKDEKVDFSNLNTQWPGFPPCLPEQKHSDPCSRQASGRSKTSGADLARGFVLYRPIIRADGWRVWSRMACKATTPTHRCLRRWSKLFFRAEAERFITDDWRVSGRRGTTHVGGMHTHRC